MAKKQATKPPVSQKTVDSCLAWAIALGDIVNFRYLFHISSPLRNSSSEQIAWDKYAYVRPGDGDSAQFRKALEMLRQADIQAHVKQQLDKKSPVQLPAALVLELADNAVRLGKYHSAAQAYELLRVRRRMQETFFAQADNALDAHDVPRAVRGYLIATGLDYDYAAFPEPMPASPNYQTKALLLHAEYPRQPEDAVPLQPLETHLRVGLEYMLLHPEAAARLEQRSLEQRLDFFEHLVRLRDPEWEKFIGRYAKACELASQYGERLQREAEAAKQSSLADEIAHQKEGLDPREIPAALLGASIEPGEWWQYVKELAYRHPAAALFISRQWVTRDIEIVMPRYVKNSPLVTRLGLATDTATA